MCGIYCLLRKDCECGGDTGCEHNCLVPSTQESAQLYQLLSSRGPDHSETLHISVGSYHLSLASFVLWTQGDDIHPQPFISSDHLKYFMFNGDLYYANRKEIPDNQNDGLYLFHHLQQCVTNDDLLNLVSTLHGPFSFVYADIKKNKLWFGRDYFGRSSLLMTKSSGIGQPLIVITSVAPSTKNSTVIEVPSCGIFCIDLSTLSLQCFQWKCSRVRQELSVNTAKFLDFCITTMGLSVQEGENIHPATSCDMKLTDLSPNEILKLLKEVAAQKLSDVDIIRSATEILKVHVNELLHNLRQAIRVRVNRVPAFCKDCIKKRSGNATGICIHPKISVLFSGGLDSTLLAHLIASELGPGAQVDLVNTAFANSMNSDFMVPDRITGLQSYEVLKKVYPKVKFNFIHVNVTKEEVERARSTCIKDLINPLQSVLDDSIGCCLWFSARASGKVALESGEFSNYISPSRIIIVGSGADELFGGYSRHRTAYEQRGWEGLSAEIQEDIDRISIRNLGRDNRVITNNGVCSRIPFLDENFVNFVTQRCDIWTKCCPIFPRGVGEKLLLRCAVAQIVGAEHTHIAVYPKRAMQFGSRIAKLESSKEKGGDVCQRLAETNITD